MAHGYDFQTLVLKGVSDTGREVGRGAFGRVYAVKYCGMICAAKEIHPILVEVAGDDEMRQTEESFLMECYQSSLLRHPNIIQFLGIYYPDTIVGGVQERMRLPVMVMEMMAGSLTSLVNKHDKIPFHIKFSIIHDVSLGLCYLHNHDPPIIHRDLSPNNVLLTAHHVAKIGDLGVAKVFRNDNRKSLTRNPGTVDFMPPETLAMHPQYGLPMDVFSFAGVILHIFSQQWPSPLQQVQFDSTTRKRIALSEVERRQQYLNKLKGEAAVLRPLVIACLDDDPAKRPAIADVSEKIQDVRGVYMKDNQLDAIDLHKTQQLSTIHTNHLKFKSTQLEAEINLKRLVSITYLIINSHRVYQCN